MEALEKDRAAMTAAMEKTPDKQLLRLYKERGQELEVHKEYEFQLCKAVRELLNAIPGEIKKTLESKVKEVERFVSQSVNKVMGHDHGGMGR